MRPSIFELGPDAIAEQQARQKQQQQREITKQQKKEFEKNKQLADDLKIKFEESETKVKDLEKKSLLSSAKPRLEKLIKEKPEWVVYHAVRGMLPHNKLGRKIVKKVKIYRGSEHPHKAQKPETIDIN